MIYFIFVCFSVFFVFSFVRIRRVGRHDHVLFPFCELRRDIMGFLYESVFEKPGTLSREEYTSAHRLLDVVNETIHNYNQHKTPMFNLRKMVKHLSAYRKTTKVTLNIPENPQIQAFHKCFVQLLATAFIAYTPLIRWELALRLLAYAFHAGRLAGQKERARRVAKYVVNHSEKVRKDARHYELIQGGAAAV